MGSARARHYRRLLEFTEAEEVLIPGNEGPFPGEIKSLGIVEATAPGTTKHHLLRSEVILPMQWEEMLGGGRDAWDSFEQRLWAQLLDDAIKLDLLNPRTLTTLRWQRRGTEARVWIQSTVMYVGSFEFVCEALDIHAGKARDLLMLERAVMVARYAAALRAVRSPRRRLAA